MRFRIRHFAYALTRRAGAQGRAGPAHAEREMRTSRAEGNANWSDPARVHACLASVLAVHAPRGRAGRSWTGTWRSTSPSCAYTGEICVLRGTLSDHAHLCAVIMRICAYAHMRTASCALRIYRWDMPTAYEHAHESISFSHTHTRTRKGTMEKFLPFMVCA
jgi:hypothetical protein